MEDKNVTGWVGWITFASIMLMIEGVLQVFYGLAALFNQTWYVATDSSVYLFNIATWGWISLVLGMLLFLTGIMLQRGSTAGRVLGIIFVILGAAYSAALMAFAPVWSIIALVI